MVKRIKVIVVVRNCGCACMLSRTYISNNGRMKLEWRSQAKLSLRLNDLFIKISRVCQCDNCFFLVIFLTSWELISPSRIVEISWKTGSSTFQDWYKQFSPLKRVFPPFVQLSSFYEFKIYSYIYIKWVEIDNFIYRYRYFIWLEYIYFHQ